MSFFRINHRLAQIVEEKNKHKTETILAKTIIQGSIASLEPSTTEQSTSDISLESRLADKSIATNCEIDFLRKIHARKLTDEKLKSIASSDFAITPEQVERLKSFGYINKRADKVFFNSEPKELTQGRIWLNTKSREILKKLEIEEPSLAIKKALKGKHSPISLGHKIGDYSLYFKVLNNDVLTLSEQQRLSSLRENGIHPESSDFQKWVKTEPASWRMKDARKKEYLAYYERSYGVNLDVLHFTNKFKQVTDTQLLQLGLSKDEIERYANGIKGQYKLLNYHWLHTQTGPIHYYSISHQGPVSGRAFLERSLKKKDIATRSQQRQDLIFHDLKVVDSVLAVIAERKKAGWQVKEIRNEITQYAQAKTGVQNNERAGGPSFMDAVIVFEEVQTQGGGSGKTETVAIEYGNYTLGRMQSKLQNSIFDNAIVFSRQDYIGKYQRHIHVPNVVFRAI